MTILLLLYIILPIGLFGLLLFWKVRSKKYLYGLPLFLLCLPLLVAISLYLLRTPIQQGRLLPEFGPMLSLAFPAEDLYRPLAEEALSPERATYTFSLSHRYLGNHAVYIEVLSDERPEFKIERGLRLDVRISEGDTVLIRSQEDRGSPFLGKGRYGFYYVGYRVPGDVPVAKEVTVEVLFDKGLEAFLQTHENARLIVRKSSDL
jgi:hypothetical protein